ncbi:MAG TPA: hypothetical protein VK507_02225 [Iamia sp.]|nr:hypothetical protein [Iamia sp.]
MIGQVWFSGDPVRVRRARRAAGALAFAAAIVLSGCGGDDGSDPKAGSSTPAAGADGATSDTTASTPEPDGGSLSGPEADDEVVDVDESDQGDEANDPVESGDEGDEANDPVEGSNGLSPGDPCSLEEGSPDCIDPDGDGEGVYLLGGAACVAGAPDPSSCADLDGDGYAGYPDSEGGDDSNGLEPGDPCSLEEGSPDCIDPDGDGEGVYLLGGADCVASAPDVSLCADLDGDGYAGYPDSEGDDSDGLEPGDPCSLEEGSPDCVDPDGDGEGVYQPYDG